MVRDSELPGFSLFQRFYLCLLLLGISVFFFALPQPNLFTVNGLPVLAYIAFVPIFLLVRFVSWKTVWLCGLFYGIGSYCLFTYWLATFHPLGIFVISLMYGLYLMLTFPLLKAAASLFPKYGWLVQWIVWCAYDYVKTLGFAGFHYGVMAYSHWRWLPMIQSADIVGVWGINALITFPSAWITVVLVDAWRVTGKTTFRRFFAAVPGAFCRHIVSAGIWAAVLVANLVYGFVAPVDYSADKKVTVALIQQNSDPWVGGTAAYRRDLNTLIRLSDEALAARPDIDFVVWPETAFVPRITWHHRHRYERDKYELVDKLLQYLDSAPVPFVIGNDHGVDGFTREGSYGVVDYNAVLLFRPGENVIPPEPEVYAKMKLVPFTEYFPFDKQFPTLYQMLLNGDTHMWEPGTEPVVFDIEGLRFSTPICFEDTFGFVGRRFVNAGANAFVNLSNDAWSKSLACQYQHLSMAVFRTIENRVPAVRATATGQTCVIDPNGRIVAMAEPFSETYLVESVPVREDFQATVYTVLGDYTGILFAAAAGILILLGIIIRICRKK